MIARETNFMHEEAVSSGHSHQSSDIEREKPMRPTADQVISDNDDVREDEENDYKNGQGALMFADVQDKFLEIIDPEEVEDVIDLNEKFLCMAPGGIEVTELANKDYETTMRRSNSLLFELF